MRVFLVLPAYNEAENLTALLNKLAQIPELSEWTQVVLVNDGSTDGTTKIAGTFQSRLKIAVEIHRQNLGLGAALRTGFKKALSLAKPEDAIAVMDADNSHPLELLLEMLKKINEGFDVIIASRYLPASREIGISSQRRLLSVACNKLLSIFFPIQGVKDYTCGYRLIRAALLKKLEERTNGTFFNENGFAATSELLLELAQCGAKISEVPLQLRYDLKKGKSKMRILHTILGYFRLILGKSFLMKR